MALLLVLALAMHCRAARYRWPLAMRQLRLVVRQRCRAALVISVGRFGCVARRVYLVVWVPQEVLCMSLVTRLRFRGMPLVFAVVLALRPLADQCRLCRLMEALRVLVVVWRSLLAWLRLAIAGQFLCPAVLPKVARRVPSTSWHTLVALWILPRGSRVRAVASYQLRAGAVPRLVVQLHYGQVALTLAKAVRCGWRVVEAPVLPVDL